MTARARYRLPSELLRSAGRGLRGSGPSAVLSIEATEAGLVGLTFEDRGPARAGLSARARAHLDATVEALDAYFAGRPPKLPALDLRGSPFQLAVWTALQAIPWGEVRTYGEVAAAMALDGGARAVGAANGKNPVAILVPCHRVVAAGGRLGGYAGGLSVKRWLLAHEAAHAPALRATR